MIARQFHASQVRKPAQLPFGEFSIYYCYNIITTQLQLYSPIPSNVFVQVLSPLRQRTVLALSLFWQQHLTFQSLRHGAFLNHQGCEQEAGLGAIQ